MNDKNHINNRDFEMRQFVFVLFVMLLLISGCSNDTEGTSPTDVGNRAPIIESVSSSLIFCGGGRLNTQITCDASDPDGDPLTYVWETNQGTISGGYTEISYTATYPGGPYRIIVTVNDGLDTDVDSLVISEITYPIRGDG
ncbi:MAG: hypothetical protein HN757_13615 [Calditrichaeota bacterium]|nr:hypothetical protein [Calditrichota bacterium]